MKNTKQQACAATVKQVLPFWNKARIPTREDYHCRAKVEKLFEEWRLLKKNEKRRSATQARKEDNFKDCFDNLFDIAHAQALTMIKIDEDKEFLLAKRDKGRRGSIAGRDKTLARKVDRKAKRLGQEAERSKREFEAQSSRTSAVVTKTSESSARESSEDDGGAEYAEPPPCKRGRKTVLTPTLCAALDRTKMSDRKAMMVVTATAQSLGQNVDQIALNRSTVRRLRQRHRE